jgi:hypothetical protein
MVSHFKFDRKLKNTSTNFVVQLVYKLGYGLGDRGSIPAGAMTGFFIFFHHRVETGSGPQPSSFPMGTRAKWPWREGDRSPLSNVEVKNA